MLEFATNAASSAARSVLGIVGVSEQRVEGLAGDVGDLREAVTAMHRTADAVERHVEALSEVTEALPALTESVTRLCEQLSALLALAAPVEAAERELSGLRRLFHRRRAPAPRPALTPPPSAPADGSGSAPR
jgi:hypothetical protein